MDPAIHIKSASFGFKGYIWRVTLPEGSVHFVHACDNYTAAEACGSSFSNCNVEEMRLVPASDA